MRFVSSRCQGIVLRKSIKSCRKPRISFKKYRKCLWKACQILKEIRDILKDEALVEINDFFKESHEILKEVKGILEEIHEVIKDFDKIASKCLKSIRILKNILKQIC